MAGKAVCVHCDGPFPDIDREGEEIPVWFVCCEDEDGNEVGKVYRCSTYAGAVGLADKMALDRNLELVMEASRA